jgi:Spy/CpxP family protein refolding chaperone
MMKRTRVAVIGCAIVFLALSGAYAQGQGKNRPGGEGKKEGLFKELKLTPEQEKKLEENRNARQQQMVTIRAAFKASHEKLQAKLNDPAVTRAAIEPLINEIEVLQAKSMKNRIDGIFEVKEILTPEQYVKFNQIMEKIRKEKKGQFKGGQDRAKTQPTGKE